MRDVRFTKMQGLGNDFVVVEGPLSLTQDEVSALCDRRFGIGADGVLVVSRAEPVGMEYWNSDGTPSEMCGNGLRCVARYAHDLGWTPGRTFPIATPIGERRARVSATEVEVEIGRPKVSGHTEIDGERLHLVDVGNPHAVMIVDDPDLIALAEVGPRIAGDARFADGTNVEFMRVADGRVGMRVWERGVGETLACGSGMVAAAFVATKTHDLGDVVGVEVPGGLGQVEFRDGVAWLRGPAEVVFTGSVEIR